MTVHQSPQGFPSFRPIVDPRMGRTVGRLAAVPLRWASTRRRRDNLMIGATFLVAVVCGSIGALVEGALWPALAVAFTAFLVVARSGRHIVTPLAPRVGGAAIRGDRLERFVAVIHNFDEAEASIRAIPLGVRWEAIETSVEYLRWEAATASARDTDPAHDARLAAIDGLATALAAQADAVVDRLRIARELGAVVRTVDIALPPVWGSSPQEHVASALDQLQVLDAELDAIATSMTAWQRLSSTTNGPRQAA